MNLRIITHESCTKQWYRNFLCVLVKECQTTHDISLANCTRARHFASIVPVLWVLDCTISTDILFFGIFGVLFSACNSDLGNSFRSEIKRIRYHIIICCCCLIDAKKNTNFLNSGCYRASSLLCHSQKMLEENAVNIGCLHEFCLSKVDPGSCTVWINDSY